MTRGRHAALVLAFVTGVGPLAPGPAFADFSARGRSRPKPGASKPGPARPRPPRPAGAAAAGPSRAGKDGTADKQSNEALIARYAALVMSRPAEPFPLQRLAELYRERDGDLEKLISDFEKRAAQPGADRYNATVALAGIYKHDARPDLAIQTYERAIGERPTEPDAIVALANLLVDRGEKAKAKATFEHALPHVKTDAAREPVIRTLMTLSLDVGEFDAAKKYHDRIVAKAGGSFFVRAELGRELLVRREYERAEKEFRSLSQAAAGDNRALAPALRDLGRALAGQKKRAESLAVLERALSAAGQQSGLRREIFDIVVEVYRADNKIVELVAVLEKENPNDFERLSMLAALYEETGQVEKALATYRRALERRRNDISIRLKVVQLLEVQGELEKAIEEYEALVAAAPRNPEFVFELAEALLQRGERAKALGHLSKLEARSTGDEDTLTALVDFYERVEEPDRAQALLERLAGGGSGDPQHLIELGGRYYREGKEKRALETWQRVKTLIPDRARALHTLGEVYLEHDLADLALEALKQAAELSPKQAVYTKAYALALERSGSSAPQAARLERYEEALRIWEALLRDRAEDVNLSREARQHIVTLWSLMRKLDERVRPLERRFAAAPPDMGAGRLLAEVYYRLRRYPDAERTLRRIVKVAPGDAPSHRELERVLGLQRKLADAIVALERLVKLDPKRAREYYQKMAQYAAELYRDDDAVSFAAKAVELSPDDAEGHRKLGEMYYRRQDIERAIIEFRKAITQNDRLFTVYFQLADLLLNRGDVDEADRLLRRVMRITPDEELIARAVRMSIQINLGRGNLDSLEKELLPLALGNPQKPIYRRLLVEIYGNYAFPLAYEARSADPKRAEEARLELRKIGERAVKPLLDALGDDRDSQQRTAIELLSHIRNRNAGPALFSFAMGTADASLRARAMIAAGALRDPELLPRLSTVLSPAGGTLADETDTVAVAAAWGVARLEDARARPLLLGMLESEAPSIRALGAIGLGLLGNRADAAALGAMVRSADSGSLARAAAAFALGEVGQKSEEVALRGLAETTDATARAAALLSLARLGSSTAPRLVAEGLVSADDALRLSAASAATVLSTGEYRTPGERLPVPEGRPDVRAILLSLSLRGYTDAEHVAAFVKLSPEISRACVATSQASLDGARRVADALLSPKGRFGFGRLSGSLDDKAPLAAQARQALESIARSVAPAFVALSKHPAPDARALAVEVLGERREESARDAVLAALEDPDPKVKQAALSAAGRSRDSNAIGPVAALLSSDSDWPLRVQATETLGALAAGSGSLLALRSLESVALTDAFALVREAAVQALHRVDPARAKPILNRVAAKDPEPRVRKLATVLLRTER